MRRAFTCFLLIAFIAIPFTGQTDEWKRYANESGNFSVLFPASPQDSVNKSENGVQSHTLMAINQPYVYTVVYTSMASAQKVDEPTYQVFKNAVFKELPNCEVGAERTAAPAIEGYIGRWYQLNCAMPTKVTILGNLYWGKHYAYAVMVMFRANVAEPQMTAKFLDSFGLIDHAK